MLRDGRGVVLNTFLYAATGALLGAVFMGEEFVGPLPEEVQALCPEGLEAMCSIPQNNQLPVQASFCILATGLLGQAASVNVFGREKAFEARRKSRNTCYWSQR